MEEELRSKLTQLKHLREEAQNAYKMSGKIPPCFALSPPGGGGDSHMEQTGMLVGNFEFNP